MYAKDIHATYKLLAHQAPLELRALKVHADGRTACIQNCLIHSSEQLVKICKKYDGIANLYVGLRERREEFVPGRGSSAKKQDIIAVTALVVDIDPIRPRGLEKQATTEAELNAAIAEARYQRDLIARRGFVPPLLAMSGNGCQLWFFIPRYELPDSGWYPIRKNPKTGEEVLTHTFESRLKAFEEEVRQSISKEGAEKVKIDSIYDLPRIIKVIGTLSVKGDSIKYPNRPHRVSRWLDKPIRKEDPKLLAYLLELPVQAETLNFKENRKLPKIFLNSLASDSKFRKLWENPPPHGDTSARDWAIGLACLEHGIHEPQMLFDILSQKPHGKFQRDGYVPYLHMTVSNLLATLSQRDESSSQLHLKFREENKSTVQLTRAEKSRCFMSLFRGRTDVFAKRWEKKDGSRSGYSPACYNEWVKVIIQFNPYYLFGLTATPKRKYNDEKLIFVYLGDIVYEVPKDYNHEIFSMKHTFAIHVRKTDFSMPFRVKTDDFHLLSRALIFDRMRNELIVKDVSEYAKKGYKCLVLTERKEHVKVLHLYLKRKFEVIPLTGDLSKRKRKEVEKQIHLGHFQILVATGQLIGEGTDFPNLDCLFLAYPFSFEGKLIQYIGRIEHGTTERGRLIFDYRDNRIPVLEKQFKKRNRYYKKLRDSIILQD